MLITFGCGLWCFRSGLANTYSHVSIQLIQSTAKTFSRLCSFNEQKQFQ